MISTLETYDAKTPEREAVGASKFFVSPRPKPWETVFVVPYVAHSGITTSGHTTRTHLLSFLGNLQRRGEGGTLREKLVDTQGVTLHRTFHHVNLTQSDDSFGEYPKMMMSSEMCLIIEGDTLSSRRLFDAILAGCIPVFLGRRFGACFWIRTAAAARGGAFSVWMEFTGATVRGSGRPRGVPLVTRMLAPSGAKKG
jgi:hypothetical protein